MGKGKRQARERIRMKRGENKDYGERERSTEQAVYGE